MKLLKKKFLFYGITSIVSIAIIPISVVACSNLDLNQKTAEGFTPQKFFTWNINNETNTATLVSLINPTGLGVGITNVSIPPFYSENGINYPVTNIGRNAFFNFSITTLVIPDTVITIQPFAFINNDITSLTIPNSVISIGASAFANNNITHLNLNNNPNFTQINSNSFYGNPIKELTIPNQITSIGDSAFLQAGFLADIEGENALVQLNLNFNLQSIGSRAFGFTKNLKQVIIPNPNTSWVKIGQNASFSPETTIIQNNNIYRWINNQFEIVGNQSN